ncbi:hypothetical protein HLB44_15315 [Aquincola sp. S2]|uniref:Uncharacterized protein n=1 Tax=Pseudaquabacterium terrae TaxID=2732868 RepID=A0ABX2EIF3_9BURK|nr:hypothetical protein [Aquabacterium terrae]NRF68362.1 hypothetical protein [Aquabacterium terrae]
MLKPVILALALLVAQSGSAQQYADVRGCWLKEIVVDGSGATLRFGRGANGAGSVTSLSDQDVVLSRYRVDGETVLTESSPDNFSVRNDSIRLIRGQVITLSGFHAGCRFSWIHDGGRQGVEVVATDTSGPGFQPYTVRTFLPLRE